MNDKQFASLCDAVEKLAAAVDALRREVVEGPSKRARGIHSFEASNAESRLNEVRDLLALARRGL
jgi:hypothetical protein